MHGDPREHINHTTIWVEHAVYREQLLLTGNIIILDHQPLFPILVSNNFETISWICVRVYIINSQNPMMIVLTKLGLSEQGND